MVVLQFNKNMRLDTTMLSEDRLDNGLFFLKSRLLFFKNQVRHFFYHLFMDVLVRKVGDMWC